MQKAGFLKTSVVSAGLITLLNAARIFADGMPEEDKASTGWWSKQHAVHAVGY